MEATPRRQMASGSAWDVCKHTHVLVHKYVMNCACQGIFLAMVHMALHMFYSTELEFGGHREPELHARSSMVCRNVFHLVAG